MRHPEGEVEKAFVPCLGLHDILASRPVKEKDASAPNDGRSV
jgi:hypothetical protein